MIESRCGNGSPADGRLANDAIPLPMKMSLPVIDARVKQWHLEASIRIDNFNAVSLAQIAPPAGPRQIVELRLAAVRAWNDMLNV
jgi:hypothetical protein